MNFLSENYRKTREWQEIRRESPRTRYTDLLSRRLVRRNQNVRRWYASNLIAGSSRLSVKPGNWSLIGFDKGAANWISRRFSVIYLCVGQFPVRHVKSGLNLIRSTSPPLFFLSLSLSLFPWPTHNNGNPTFQTFSEREAERQTLVRRFLSFFSGVSRDYVRLERRTMEG